MSLLRLFSTALLALAAGMAVMLLVKSNTLLSLFTQALIYALFASGIGLLLRQNGMVSFGHALYFGVSGYAMGLLLQGQWLSAEWAMAVLPL